MSLIADSWKIDAVAIFILLLTVLYIFFKWQYSYWERKGIETLPGLNYLFGHFGSMYFQRESLADLTVRLYRASNAPFSGMYGFLRRILVCDQYCSFFVFSLIFNFSIFTIQYLLL